MTSSRQEMETIALLVDAATTRFAAAQVTMIFMVETVTTLLMVHAGTMCFLVMQAMTSLALSRLALDFVGPDNEIYVNITDPSLLRNQRLLEQKLWQQGSVTLHRVQYNLET